MPVSLLDAIESKKKMNGLLIRCDGDSLVAQMVKNPSVIQETQFNPWAGKIPWRREWLPTPVFTGFPGGSDSKVSACNVEDLGLIPGLEDLLEEGMVTNSSILAWRTPWTEESGGLQCMGLQRVRHDEGLTDG